MTGCELVLVAALIVSPKRIAATQPRRVCLHQILAKARREGAVVVDMRPGKRGRVYTPDLWRAAV